MVLDASNLSPDQMLQVAALLKFSETVFVTSMNEDHVRVKYFTPTKEIDLCGHATIATIAALHIAHLLPKADGVIHTNVGEIKFHISTGQPETCYMQQLPLTQRELTETDLNQALAALGISPKNVLNAAIIGTGIEEL